MFIGRPACCALGLVFISCTTFFISFAHILVYFTFAFALTCIFLHCADLMLGKGKLAELRALARTHKLASGSQTVPNSVVEIAAAQGRSPPQGPAPPEALPAPQRKKLILRKPKRKTPQVVQEDEEEMMRRLRTALSPKGRGWHLLLHPLSQHQLRPLPQLQHRRSKQYPWQLRFLLLKATSLTSWRTLLVPPRNSYLLERVLLQLPQSLKLHQVVMKALTTHQYS